MSTGRLRFKKEFYGLLFWRIAPDQNWTVLRQYNVRDVECLGLISTPILSFDANKDRLFLNDSLQVPVLYRLRKSPMAWLGLKERKKVFPIRPTPRTMRDLNAPGYFKFCGLNTEINAILKATAIVNNDIFALWAGKNGEILGWTAERQTKIPVHRLKSEGKYQTKARRELLVIETMFKNIIKQQIAL